MTYRSNGIVVLLSLIAFCCGGCGTTEPTAGVPATEDPVVEPAEFHESTGHVERTVDGVTSVIPYLRRGAGPGKPVLLVLGGPFCIEWFGRWAEPAYDVIYFKPAGDHHLTTQRIADIEALVAELKITKPYLFGHTVGATVMLEYAAKHPTEVSGVIWVAGLSDQTRSIRQDFELLSTTVSSPTSRMRFEQLVAKESYNALELGLAAQARKESPMCKQAEACRRGFTLAAEASSNAGYKDLLQLMYGDTQPTAKDLLMAAVTEDVRGTSGLEYRSMEAVDTLKEVPFLMVQGKQDTTVRPEATRELAAALPKAKLVELEDCGHLPFLEQQDKFLAEFAAFLDLGDLEPTASLVEEGWKPMYDDGTMGAEALEADAVEAMQANADTLSKQLFGGACELVGPGVPIEILVELRITETEARDFHSNFCRVLEQ